MPGMNGTGLRGFPVVFAVVDFLELVPGFGEQLVTVASSFHGPGLFAEGADVDELGGGYLQQSDHREAAVARFAGVDAEALVA